MIEHWTAGRIERQAAGGACARRDHVFTCTRCAAVRQRDYDFRAPPPTGLLCWTREQI